MKRVFAVGSHAISALGMDADAHWDAVISSRLGVREYENTTYSDTPFWASMLSQKQWSIIPEHDSDLSPFERMALLSAKEALKGVTDGSFNTEETVFILSTTKGNIEWLNQVPDSRIALMESAKRISTALGLSTNPVIISQACISGVAALTYGLRLLQGGRYKHAIVTGADRFTRFVLSGFQSFQAIANGACKPFDAERTGINLGEAAATIILSTEVGSKPLGQLLSGATSNDANHISGPSRTGEELALAIQSALHDAQLSANDINAISAHGTATLYNDEMESKAFSVAGLTPVPIHSFKGYVGHTLGAAGVLESVMLLQSMERNRLIPSAGFEKMGVSQHLNITTKLGQAQIKYALKTASGFGGSNAALIWGSAD